MKILVVDDSPVMRNLIKKAINKIDGFEIVGEAKNGKEAIELAEKLSPDIITMDLTMPVMGGFEAATEILKEFTGKQIILITSIKDAETTKKAEELGIKHILQKPFPVSLLEKILKEIKGE